MTVNWEAEAKNLESLFRAGFPGREPWKHQIQAVVELLRKLRSRGRESEECEANNLLIQHATGSGKSATMALLSRALAMFRDEDRRGFALVVVLSDRTQLDRQLGDVVEIMLKNTQAFASGCHFRRADDGASSLVKALGSAVDCKSASCRIIVTTKHKFDRLLHSDKGSGQQSYKGLLSPIFQRGRVALICEECHRGHYQGSATSVAVRRLFEQESRSSAQHPDLTYIGFTATPDARSLRMFGERISVQGLTMLRPTHCYHLGEAEDDGIIINVLQTYRQAPAQLRDRRRPNLLIQKAAWLIQDMSEKIRAIVSPAFRREAKAMLICSSRQDVIAYVLALRQLSEESQFTSGSKSDSLGVYGFFSGEMNGQTEKDLNGGIDLQQATSRARLLVVCQKLETGYDEPRLSIMYLDRPLRSAVACVQVLSRLNRKWSGKSMTSVVDFHASEETIRSSFERFRLVATTKAISRLRSTGCDRKDIGRCPKCENALRENFASYGTGDSAPLSHRRQVLWEGRVAKRLLTRVVPSRRYGGKQLKMFSKTIATRLRVKNQESVEAPWRRAMRVPLEATPSSLSSSIANQKIVSRTLVAEGTAGIAARLVGPERKVLDFWRAAERHQDWFAMPCAGRRGSLEEVYPVFICSKGRSSTGHLEWRAPHCFGAEATSPVVVVVEPQEEEQYRSAWPQGLFLVLSSPNGTAIGHTRFVVQAICTHAREAESGRLLKLPFIWMADDLLVAFYKLESSSRKIHPKQARAKPCGLKALPTGGFTEAFLAVQQRQEICDVAVAGFLRERGSAVFVKRNWVLDGSIALQKVVLLNLPKLSELGVQYCRHLRKAEDLALCYDVIRRPGGHVLKAQAYCYRALHLERGGAEEVRKESRSNQFATYSEFILGGQEQFACLAPLQQGTVAAILAWLQRKQIKDRLDENRKKAKETHSLLSSYPSSPPSSLPLPQVRDGTRNTDHHGDYEDPVEAIGSSLLEELSAQAATGSEPQNGRPHGSQVRREPTVSQSAVSHQQPQTPPGLSTKHNHSQQPQQPQAHPLTQPPLHQIIRPPEQRWQAQSSDPDDVSGSSSVEKFNMGSQLRRPLVAAALHPQIASSVVTPTLPGLPARQFKRRPSGLVHTAQPPPGTWLQKRRKFGET